MTAIELSVAVVEASIANRHRLMTEAIESGDARKSGEHAGWLAFLGMELMAQKAGVGNWQMYGEIQKWWNGGME